MSDERYARHIALFGADGQKRLAKKAVAVVGLGGLGAHVVQQLAYLGVKRMLLVDHDRVDASNLNRLIGAGPEDVGQAKVKVAEREAGRIAPDVAITSITSAFDAGQTGDKLEGADLLFGCVDDDPVRLALVRYSSTQRVPYLDLASDVTENGEYGGRIVFAANGEHCLSCLGELDQRALARAQMADSQLEADDRIYGVDRSALAAGGPSVVSVNGVVASLAVNEFMAWATGLRAPRAYITYRGDLPSVGVRRIPERSAYCHYCNDLWGKPPAAERTD